MNNKDWIYIEEDGDRKVWIHIPSIESLEIFPTIANNLHQVQTKNGVINISEKAFAGLLIKLGLI